MDITVKSMELVELELGECGGQLGSLSNLHQTPDKHQAGSPSIIDASLSLVVWLL